jgi:hypothetical protein
MGTSITTVLVAHVASAMQQPASKQSCWAGSARTAQQVPGRWYSVLAAEGILQMYVLCIC